MIESSDLFIPRILCYCKSENHEETFRFGQRDRSLKFSSIQFSQSLTLRQFALVDLKARAVFWSSKGNNHNVHK